VHPKPTATVQKHVFAIDLLRFVAAMLVVAHHFGTLATRTPDPRLTNMIDASRFPAWLSSVSNFGWVGIEIFFVISGYVIAASAERSSPGSFLRRRYLRLAPAAWICASLTLASLIVTTGVDRMVLLIQWLRSASLLTTSNTIDPSYWTISIEIAFYLIVATQLRDTGKERRLNLLALVLGSISTTFALLVQFGVTDPQPAYYWQLLLVEYGCFFSLGMVVQSSQAHGWSRWRAAFCSIQALTGLLEIQTHTPIRALGIAGQFSPQLIAFLVAMLVVVAAPTLQSALAKPRRARISTLLGKTTYPLYLIHQTAGTILIGVLLKASMSGLPAILLTVLIALATAMLIAAYVEPAVRSYAARLLFTRAPRQDIPPTASPSTG
jgi:peptidoglycan/LPS O-acetylase OafA/YrhL